MSRCVNNFSYCYIVTYILVWADRMYAWGSLSASYYLSSNALVPPLDRDALYVVVLSLAGPMAAHAICLPRPLLLPPPPHVL
jgi:hypothetical protein